MKPKVLSLWNRYVQYCTEHFFSYVKLPGGKIWVKSEPDRGASFYFTLPRHKDATEQNTVVSEKADIPASKAFYVKDLNILVVEDDYASCVLISKMLSKIGKKIITAQTGPEAVDVCRCNSNIDLVLMDIKLPEMNGYDATRKIREFNKDVIIIAQTAHAMEGDKEMALEAGCNNYVSKPVIQSDLLFSIQECFDAK
jgi:CheY-like chemotaxis protein